MRAVITFLAAQSRTAELVLVTTFAELKTSCFFDAASRRKRSAMDVGRTRPHTAPARARRPDVVVHLPAWSKPIAFVRGADCFDHLAANYVTEIGETVERFERAYFVPETPHRFPCGGRDLISSPTTFRINTLFIPGVVGGWTSQAIAWISSEPRQQMVQPSRTHLRATLEQHEHVSIAGSKPVETRCSSARFRSS